MNFSEQLQESPLFKSVAPADREALVSAMRRQSYPAGAVLFEKGSAGDSVYIIVSGRIRIYSHDEQGREFTIRHYGPTEVFGEFSMLDEKPRSASAAAAEDTDVLVLHRNEFLAFLRERPLVGLAMMRHLVERVRYTTSYLQRVLDATQRLSRGEYDHAAVQELSTSAAEAEIQQLIDAFLNMVSSVQAREQTLQHEIAPPSSPHDS